jgi:RNA polymerase sigma factor (sigma-70 family)
MSFEEVYKKYYNELRLFGRRLDISAESRDDLLQETFMKYYLELRTGTVFGNPRAWLYKVFLNLFRNYLGSARNNIVHAEMTTQTEAPAHSVHDDYTVREKQQIVLDAMEGLTDGEKEILLLYHQGFSYNEIAGITGINPGSMGKTLSRTIIKLRNSLKIRYNEMFDKG